LHGNFWRADQLLAQDSHQFTNNYREENKKWPKIAIIIPARNEEQSIYQAIKSHLQSNYKGVFTVTLVNDHSEDQTEALAIKAANNDKRFNVVCPPPLPKGWSGKLWALHHGVVSLNTQYDYILFTDADIIHAPDTLSALTTKAMAEKLDMISLMAKLDMRGLWGKTLIPAFVYFFMKLYPFAKANDPHNRLAGAAGGCMLISYERLDHVGSIQAIKDALIDDCTLAEKIKNTLPRSKIFIGLAINEVISIRDNTSFASIWKMVSRTAYTQLDHSPVKLLFALIGMVLIYLMPLIIFVLSVILHHIMLLSLSLITITLMLSSFWPTIRHYKLSPVLVFSLPLSAILYCAMTINSARLT